MTTLTISLYIICYFFFKAPLISWLMIQELIYFTNDIFVCGFIFRSSDLAVNEVSPLLYRLCIIASSFWYPFNISGWPAAPSNHEHCQEDAPWPQRIHRGSYISMVTFTSNVNYSFKMFAIEGYDHYNETFRGSRPLGCWRNV